MAGFDITYLYPVAGSAPSLARMRRNNAMVLNLVTEAGAKEDATAIVHNLQLSPADGSDGRPEVQITKLASGIVLTDLSVAFTNLNTLTFTKIIKGANTGATFRVVIRRPQSIGR
jgi:hypothetical protein